MKPNESGSGPRNSLLVGSVAWMLSVGLYRAHNLGRAADGGFSTFLFLLQGDLKTASILCVLVVLAAWSSRPWLRGAVLAAVGGLLILFASDAVLTLLFDVRPTWADARRLSEVFYAGPVLERPLVLVLVFGGVSAMFLRIEPSRRSRIAVVSIAVLLMVLGNLPVTPQADLDRYHLSVLESFWQGASETPSLPYSRQEAARAFSQWQEPPLASFGGERPNIVVVVVESLSASDSHRTSGLANLVPNFDQMANDGTLFTNFLSSGRSSIDALIALLGGVLPCHYPGLGKASSHNFRSSGAFVRQLKARGYHLSYVTGWELRQRIDWFALQEYMEANAFDQAIGRSHPALANAPQHNYMPLDQAVLDLARERIDDRLRTAQPFFMQVATVSSHPPYGLPANIAIPGDEPRVRVMAYVDRELRRFYEGLSTTSFFDNGILVVVGDHRHWGPLGAAEQRRYGDSAIARVPLLLIGKGIPRGKSEERYFQQHDLLRHLDLYSRPQDVLNEAPLFVEYTTHRGVISAFSLSDDARRRHRLLLSAGRDMIWEGPPHELAEAIEAGLHRQRAALMYLDSIQRP